MNNDDSCLICFEDDVDTILTCCNKKIHGSCVKQWWNMNNITLEQPICPHCQQSAKLEKYEVIQNDIETDSKISDNSNKSDVKYLIGKSNRNKIYPENYRIIVPNVEFNLTDEEIQLINSNRNNIIPTNAFSHESNPDENVEQNCYLNIAIFICLLIMIILIAVFTT